MGLLVLCGLILGLYRNEFTATGGSLRFRIASFIEVTGQKGAVLLGGAFVTLVALLLSQSRGGTLSTAAGLFVFGALALKARNQGFREHRAASVIFGALLVVLVGVVFLSFGGAVTGRIAQQGVQDSSRMAIYTITMRSILDAPLLGYGYGTFADVFPMFRDKSLSTFDIWQMAHNTYLEVFQGLGLIFGSMLVASIVLLAVRCAKGAMKRQENEAIPCVAVAVAVLVGVHSLIDFSLQIQAIGVTFMALLGTGVAQSKSSQLILAD
jgi:O-antigen ligase